MADPRRLVVVASPGAPPTRWRGLLRGRDWSWTYFGRRHESYRRVRAEVGADGAEIVAGEAVNRIAGEIRRDFLDFDRCLELEGRELLWQATDVAERNPYTSDLFYNCCAVLAFEEVLRRPATSLLVFAEDRFVAGELARRARSAGASVVRVGSRRIPPGLVDRVVELLELARGIYRRARFVWGARSRARALATSDPSSPPPDVLLAVWATSSTFDPAEPIATNVYFGELPRALREAGARVGYLATPAAWVEPVEAIGAHLRSAADWIVTPDECLRVSDALALALRTLFVRFPIRRPFRLRGTDLTPLLRRELRRERTKHRQTWALQFSHVGRALRARGLTPSAVLHLYENQPWEKALRAGIRRHLPGTRVVAYQHSPFSPLWLAYLPTPRDVELGEHPALLAVSGIRWREDLRAQGVPEDSLVLVPAVRFAHLAERQRLTKREELVALVATSIGAPESHELLWKALEALGGVPGVRVLLKLHPMTTTAALSLPPLPANAEVVERPVSELVLEADVLLYNATSVCYEALALGLPAIFVRSDVWLDLDPLPTGSGAAFHARTPQEIRAIVDRLRDGQEAMNEDRRREAARVVSENLALEPASLAPLLDLLWPEPVQA